MGEPDTASESRGTLRREREAHQQLLADSHGLVMDLRWQMHHSEKNWRREKVELLERLDHERHKWEQQQQELAWRVEQVSVATASPRGSASTGVRGWAAPGLQRRSGENRIPEVWWWYTPVVPALGKLEQ